MWSKKPKEKPVDEVYVELHETQHPIRGEFQQIPDMIDDFVMATDTVTDHHIEQIVDFVQQFLDVNRGEISKFDEISLTKIRQRRINFNALTL